MNREAVIEFVLSITGLKTKAASTTTNALVITWSAFQMPICWLVWPGMKLRLDQV